MPTSAALRTGCTRGCALPAEVIERLGELRAWLAGRARYVSDRRWVKIAHLLRVAAASEGRAAASEWDLGLVPYCVAADDRRGWRWRSG